MTVQSKTRSASDNYTAVLRGNAWCQKWLQYQRERFPVLQHGPLVILFAVSGVSYATVIGGGATPSFQQFAVAIAVCFCFFLQLRILDEFKDFAEDCRYRPYRAVPRGLITLKELAGLGVVTMLAQSFAALVLTPKLLILLFAVWCFQLLMAVEFGVGSWLKTKPLLYMASHLMVIPFIDLFATACHWILVRDTPPQGLFYFLLAGYFAGGVIEVGRKIRKQHEEEEGVLTYSAQFGIARSLCLWLGLLCLSMLSSLGAAALIGSLWLLLPVVLLVQISCIGLSILFVCRSESIQSSRIELFSGIWVLAMYATLGPFALFGAG